MSIIAYKQFTAPQINGVYYIDGTVYPKTSDGITTVVNLITTSGIIYLSPGTYDMTSKVTITNKYISFINLGGASGTSATGSVVLKKNASWTTGAIFEYSNTTSYIVGGMKFSGIVLDGNGEAGNGLTLTGVAHSTFENLTVVGFTDSTSIGISFVSSDFDYPCVNNVIRDSYFTNNKICVKVSTSGAGATAGWATQNVIDHVWMNESPANDDEQIVLDGSGGLIELAVINSYLEQMAGKTNQEGINADGNARVMSMRTTYAFPDGSDVNLSGLTDNGQSRSNFLNCDIADPINYATRFVDNADADLKATIIDNNGAFLSRSDMYFTSGKSIYLYSGATAYSAFTFNTGADQWVSAEDGLVAKPTSAGAVPLIARGAGSQTANLLEIQSSTPATLAAFEADGTLVFDGSATVFNDANVGALVLRTGGTAPGVVQIVDEAAANTGIYTVGFAINEEGSGSIEVPHDYDEGTNLTFHVHWGANDAPTDTDYVKWQLTYTVQRDGTTFDPATVIVIETAYDTRYKWLRSDFPAITGTNFKIGDQFMFSLKRIAAAGDAFGGEALVATIGFHYACDTLGSRTIAAK